MKKQRYLIRVPGTSANLGPGFDIMGLAVNVYNQFFFEFSDKSAYKTQLVDGRPVPFEPSDDLVWESYKRYFSIFLPNQEPLPYDLSMDLNLPLKGGLGSSASAVVAGFSAARLAHKKFYKSDKLPDENLFLYELAEVEGHADNTIPAYMGGLVLAYFIERKRLHFFKKKLPTNVSIFIFIPNIEIETSASRRTLPVSYSTKDVIYNMARVATWFEFLGTKRFSHLRLAVKDKLHTPYRITKHPVLPKLSEFIEKLGGCYSLSGSGPSLLLYCKKSEEEKFHKEVELFLNEHISSELLYSFKKLKVDNKGTIIKKL